jgi:uncharacterized protein YdeI (YjbR/CyaY-like superfamily)
VKEFARVEISSRQQWRQWLHANWRQSDSIWLVTHKKSEGDKHVPYAAVVEEALCYGWIDSLPRKLDARRGMLLLSPRRAGSPWSALNKRRVASLLKQGLIMPPGQAKIDAAIADGSWTVYDKAESLEEPADLTAALRAVGTEAVTNFRAFSPSSRRGILWWIASAKRDETRARRLAETARLAAQNIKANHPRQT